MANLSVFEQPKRVFISYCQYLPFSTVCGLVTEYEPTKIFRVGNDFVLVLENPFWGTAQLKFIEETSTPWQLSFEAHHFSFGKPIEGRFIKNLEGEWVCKWEKGEGLFKSQGEIKIYFK